MRRGPLPKLPRVPEVTPFARDGESDQDYKCRLVSEKYQGVTGSNEQEADMVDFFKQVLAAENRVVISSFVISVMVSRYWGYRPLADGHCSDHHREDYDAAPVVDAPGSLCYLRQQIE